jgi:aspartyl-tRNA(Asn)/glutamyl-tRNA(Gln) amidotransferase subunit A
MELENNVLGFDLISLSNGYKEKKVSPVEIIQLMFERLKKIDGKLNSFITTDYENSIAEARKAEKEILQGNIKGPLHGVPIALKDLIYTTNLKTTMGSGVFKDFVPNYDATVVNQLRDAGAIIIGKTNTHEFAYGPTGDYSYFNPIKNPYDISKIAFQISILY